MRGQIVELLLPVGSTFKSSPVDFGDAAGTGKDPTIWPLRAWRALSRVKGKKKCSLSAAWGLIREARAVRASLCARILLHC